MLLFYVYHLLNVVDPKPLDIQIKAYFKNNIGKAQKQKKRALQDFLQKGETAPSFDLASTNLSDQ